VLCLSGVGQRERASNHWKLDRVPCSIFRLGRTFTRHRAMSKVETPTLAKSGLGWGTHVIYSLHVVLGLN